MSHPTAAETIIDVRRLLPRMRHPLILQTFERLRPGEAIQLINDHDPKPLFHHFNEKHHGTFGWDYQEEGPHVWRVRISRTTA